MTQANDESLGLGNALFPGGRQRVLQVLFGNPDRAYHVNDLRRLTKSGKGGLQRELTALARVGLINLRKVGNQVHCQANRDAPIFEELRSIVRKTFGMAEPLRSALQSLGNAVRAAFIFGSVAKGTDTAASDVDVFVLSDSLDYGTLMEALAPCEQQLGRKINPVLYSTSELRAKLAENASFITRIISQERIPLIGSTDAPTEPGKPGKAGETAPGKARPGGIRRTASGRKADAHRRAER